MDENNKIVPTDIAYTSCILMNNIDVNYSKKNYI